MHQRLRNPSSATKSALLTQRSFETTKSGRRISPSSLPPSATADLAEQQQLIEHAKQIPQQPSYIVDTEKLGQLHEALSSHPSDYLGAEETVADEEKLPYSDLSKAQTATNSEATSSSGSSTFSSATSTNLKGEPPGATLEAPSRQQRPTPLSPTLPPGLASGSNRFWRQRRRLTQAFTSCFSGSGSVKV